MITNKTGTYARLTPEEKEARKKTGANIRKIRSQVGFTQQHTEELLGMTEGTLSAIERGEAPINENFLNEFCKEFGVSKDTVVWKPAKKQDLVVMSGEELKTDTQKLSEIMAIIRKAGASPALTNFIDGMQCATKKADVDANGQELLDSIRYYQNELDNAEINAKTIASEKDETIQWLKALVSAKDKVIELLQEKVELLEELRRLTKEAKE